MPKTRVIHWKQRHDYDEEDCIYIGRAMPRQRLKASPWSNPHKITPDCDREQAIVRYRAHLEGRLREDPHLWEELAELSGKVLLCWCKPDDCHGDVLAEMADRAALQLEEEAQYWSDKADANSL